MADDFNSKTVQNVDMTEGDVGCVSLQVAVCLCTEMKRKKLLSAIFKKNIFTKLKL